MTKINNISSNESTTAEKNYTTEAKHLIAKYALNVTAERLQVDLDNIIKNEQKPLLEKTFNRRGSQKMLDNLFKQISSSLLSVITIKKYKEKNLRTKNNRYTFLPDYNFYENCIEKNPSIKQEIEAYLLECESLNKENSPTKDMEATICFWSTIDALLKKDPLDDDIKKSINTLWKEHVFSLIFICIDDIEKAQTKLMNYGNLLNQYKAPRTSIYKTKKLVECERICKSLRFLYAYYFCLNPTFNNVCDTVAMVENNIGRNNDENFYDKQHDKGRLLDFIYETMEIIKSKAEIKAWKDKDAYGKHLAATRKQLIADQNTLGFHCKYHSMAMQSVHIPATFAHPFL